MMSFEDGGVGGLIVARAGSGGGLLVARGGSGGGLLVGRGGRSGGLPEARAGNGAFGAPIARGGIVIAFARITGGDP